MTQTGFQNIIIVGASGAIGAALVRTLLTAPSTNRLFALSRKAIENADPRVTSIAIDLEDEESLRQAAAACQLEGGIDLIINAIGILHEGEHIRPEKGLRELAPETMARLFHINTIGPVLVLKHFSPLLARDRRAITASLSARVGSISDNKTGGWYSYRATKAALNQLIRTASIELAARRPQVICVGLHPGTVRSAMSEPFLQRYTKNEIFEPDTAAAALLSVLAELTPAQTGRVFAWDGQEIQP
ncbi:SDR family NAD(P)-dependent oxidoreductase [Aquidulcibacter sp.]|jgi:NAD(P)-dependent dehydrogenase (short-subunit alcohol dehydrogenase family)|uniref:SDR family NAD(P)-dependent oxidoreductase n=1 Tax=Aquidulcibacter sp. TaxID=2052990 RepID=UPI0028AA5B89|nr:SDR family NAD(P)-dependent oxidoreductase [Aquidulcibacter sp.]